MTVAMKNSLSPRVSPNPRSECTRISEICAVTSVAIDRRIRALRIDHAPARGARRSCSRWMRRLRLVITRYAVRRTIATGIVSRYSEWWSSEWCQAGTDGINSRATAPRTVTSWSRSERVSTSPSPPAIIAAPSTSRMFETTEPVSVPRTTSGRPSATANRAMISSGALPKLALRNPPTPAPVCSAAWSVASPINHASGISAIAERRNSVVASACNT